MKPAPFTLHRPDRIEDALALLSAESAADVKIIAGGQSLVPLMNLRMATPAVVVDLGRIKALQEIRVADGFLVLGAMTRQSALLDDERIARHAPLLRIAAAHIGHVQTRARGTVGGSLAHGDPAAELSTTMVALDAVFTLRSARGIRKIPARRFYAGFLATELAEDELLCDIAIPCAVAESRVAFRELARRHGDFAIVSVAAHAWPHEGVWTISACLGGVEPVPHLCAALSHPATTDPLMPAALAEFVRHEIETLDPISDIHASGPYRRQLAQVLLAQCLADVVAA